MCRRAPADAVLSPARCSGTKLLVINVHLFWDPEFALVKSLQAAMVLKWVKELRKSIAKSDAKGAAPATGTGTGAGGDASGGELRRRKGKGAAKGGAGAGGGATHAEAASGVATVVLGDFNSMPEGEYQPASGAYLVMTRAEGLPHTHSEHPRSRHSGGMALRQAPLAGLQPPLASCYRTAHGEEPAFTNFKSDFHGCLDYIFVSDELVRSRWLLVRLPPCTRECSLSSRAFVALLRARWHVCCCSKWRRCWICRTRPTSVASAPSPRWSTRATTCPSPPGCAGSEAPGARASRVCVVRPSAAGPFALHTQHHR